MSAHAFPATEPEKNVPIDEYRLLVHPVVVGAGTRLFGDTDGVEALQLVDSKPLGSGVVILTYCSAT